MATTATAPKPSPYSVTRSASYNLRLSPEERELVHLAARAAGKTTRDYIAGLVLEAARKDTAA